MQPAELSLDWKVFLPVKIDRDRYKDVWLYQYVAGRVHLTARWEGRLLTHTQISCSACGGHWDLAHQEWSNSGCGMICSCGHFEFCYRGVENPQLYARSWKVAMS